MPASGLRLATLAAVTQVQRDTRAPLDELSTTLTDRSHIAG